MPLWARVTAWRVSCRRAPAVDGTDQDTAGDAFGFADDVEAVVDAVDEKDIGAARGPKGLRWASGHEGVGGAVAFGQIGLGLGDDAVVGAELDGAAEEGAGDVDGGLGEEAGCRAVGASAVGYAM